MSRTLNPRITVNIGTERKQALNDYIASSGQTITWLLTKLLDDVLTAQKPSQKIITRKKAR